MKSLSKPANNVARFVTLSGHKKWLLVKVFGVLATYKCLLLIFPFNKFLKTTAKAIRPAAVLSTTTLTDTVWAIQVVSNRIPLGFTCLVQALGAKWLLHNNPDVRVCIGVHKSIQQDFLAHAWVVYKEKIILGEQANQVFEPILDWN
ncbi:lasso peptide biosynthesis B2 protein [Spirosoma humi]